MSDRRRPAPARSQPSAWYNPSDMRPRRALACLAMAVALTGLAQAGPTIRVRARSRIRIEKIVREAFGARITGRLIDASNGGGIDGQKLELHIEGNGVNLRETALTGQNGAFQIAPVLPLGAYTASAAYAGDANYGGSDLLGRTFDVAKDALNLTLQAPSSVNVSAAETEIMVAASYDNQPRVVEIALSFRAVDTTGAAGDEVSLGTVTTDAATGKASAKIPVAKLGPPGQKRVTASFAGDTAFNGTSAEATMTVVSPVTVTLTGPKGTLTSDRKIDLSGTVRDHKGPLAQVPIAITSGGRRVADVLSDTAGTFAVSLPASEYPSGKVAFVAEYTSGSSGRRSGRSTPIVINIKSAPPIPTEWSLLAVVATLLLVAAYVIVRTRPWRRIAALVRARRLGAGENAPTGLRTRGGIAARFRRADDTGFSGKVMDAHERKPLGGAEVVIEPALPVGAPPGSVPPIVILCDATGAFAVEHLPPGRTTGEVRRDGYKGERFAFTVPHRGELRGVAINLLPVREHVLKLYRGVVEPLLPDRNVWGFWTPRELLRHARRALKMESRSPLDDLTSLLEETYYSGRVPGDTVIARAEALAAESRPAPLRPAR